MNSPQHNPEQKRTYSEAELRKLWKKPRVTKEDYKNICDEDPKNLKSKALAEELIDLMYHPDAIELDVLTKTEFLSTKESYRCILELPIYREIVRNFKDLVKRFVRETRLDRILRKWAKDLRSPESFFVLTGDPPVEILSNKICSMVDKYKPTPEAPFVQARVELFYLQFVSQLARDMLEHLMMEDQTNDPLFQQLNITELGIIFSRFNYIGDGNFIRATNEFSIMTDPSFQKVSSQFRGCDVKQLEDDIDELEGLLEWASFKNFEIKTNDYLMGIHTAPEWSDSLFLMLLIVNGRDLWLRLDRFEKKLTCKFGLGHELNEVVGDEAAYAIQREAVSALIDHLLEKDFDLMKSPTAHVPDEEPAQAIQELVRMDVEEVIGETEPSGLPELPTEQMESQQLEDPEVLSARRTQKKSVISQIRSRLKPSEVLTALKSILGEPIRIKGSHHIFQRRPDENGKDLGTSPVSLHPGRDMTFGALMKTLKQLHVSPEEYLQAMGG